VQQKKTSRGHDWSFLEVIIGMILLFNYVGNELPCSGENTSIIH